MSVTEKEYGLSAPLVTTYSGRKDEECATCSGSCSADQIAAQRLGDRFGLRVHLELFIDPAHMEGNRIHRYFQFRGRGLIVVAVHQKLEDPHLVRAQVFFSLLHRPDALKQADDFAGN